MLEEVGVLTRRYVLCCDCGLVSTEETALGRLEGIEG